MSDWPLLDETLARWAEREVLPQDAFAALEDSLKATGGRLAGVWETRFVQDVYDSLGTAMARGVSLYDWIRDDAERLLAAYGGEIYTGTEWTPWYADLVLRNATQSAFAAGRYAQMFSPERSRLVPFVMYHAIMDARTRPAHARLDGTAWRKDDPTARRFFPPLGHNCRCSLIELDEEDLSDAGLTLSRGADMDPQLIPEGWDTDRLSLIPDVLRRLTP